jgi:hypothetical protein
MKRQKIDYSGFSLKKLTDPRFSHLLWLSGWLVYFVSYFFTENLIPEERFHEMHCFVDDLIPFSEYFVLIYAGWYLFVAGSMLYMLLYDANGLKKMMLMIILVQFLGNVWFVAYPSLQNLRPEVFPRENFCSWLLGLIYTFDNNKGVCPSLHVGFSGAILSVWLKDREVGKGAKTALSFFVFLVCLAVCFVKQHSFLDVLAAIPVVLIAEICTFGKDYWLPRWTGRNKAAPSPGEAGKGDR